jgi:hypothetical protein
MMNVVRNDDPRLLAFLESAYDLRPNDEGIAEPQFDASALLALSDWLEERGDPRADDVRGLGRARFFVPEGEPSPGPRPIACGPWWHISCLHEGQGAYHLAWGVYPGTEQHARLERVAREKALQDGMRWEADPFAPPGRVFCPYFSASPPLLRWHFEQVRLALTASLFLAHLSYIADRASLLRGDDDTVVVTLSHLRPIPRPYKPVVAELRRRDPKRYRRLRRQAAAFAAREADEYAAEGAAQG